MDTIMNRPQTKAPAQPLLQPEMRSQDSQGDGDPLRQSHFTIIKNFFKTSCRQFYARMALTAGRHKKN